MTKKCVYIRKGKCQLRGGNDIVMNPDKCRCSRYKERPKRRKYNDRTRNKDGS